MPKLLNRQIFLLAAFAAITPMAIDMYLPAMPILAHDLGVNSTSASLSVSVFFFGVAFGQLIAGPMSDRFGRRPIIISGLLIFIAASIMASVTSRFDMLLVARLAQALGACAVTVSGRAIVRDRLEPQEAARLFALLMLIGAIAPILAPSIGAAITKFGNWRHIFLIMGVGATLMLVAQILFLPESRSQETAQHAKDEHPFATYFALLTNRKILGYILTAAGNSACIFTYIANSSPILISGYGISSVQFAFIFTANSIGLVFANQYNRHQLKTKNIDEMLKRSGINAVIFAFLFTIFAFTAFGGFIVLIALLFFVVASSAIVQANALAGALSVDDKRSGSVSALYGSATFFAGTLASSAAAYLENGKGFGMSIIITVCLLVCAWAIFFIIAPSKKSQEV